MRARVVGAFAVGFAIGALCVGAGLWGTGRINAALPPWKRVVAAQPDAPAVPDMSNAAKLPETPVPPPEGMPPAPVEGSADRAAASSPGTTPTTAPATLHPGPELHLAMPLVGVNAKSLTDSFGDARDGHKHEALDMAAPRGTPVVAVAEGNVAKLFTSKQGGLTIYQFDNTGQYAFYYAHLDHYAPGLKEGMLLRKGDTLGYVGTTGDAPKNTPHLHFAVFKLGPEKNWWKGTALDPLPMLQ